MILLEKHLFHPTAKIPRNWHGMKIEMNEWSKLLLGNIYQLYATKVNEH